MAEPITRLERNDFYSIAVDEYVRSYNERPDTENALDERIRDLECLKDALDAVFDAVYQDAKGGN